MSKCCGCNKELTNGEDVKVSLPNGDSFQLLACSECGTVRRKVKNIPCSVTATNGEIISTQFKYVAEYSSTILLVVAKNEDDAKEKAFHHLCDLFYGVAREKIYIYEIGKDVEILA